MSESAWEEMTCLFAPSLELVPHPRIEHSEAIELDYGMTGGALKVEIRAASAGYLLRQWNVDCSTNATLQDGGAQLYLKNRATLYGVKNIMLAPGIEKELGN
ncbi:hypothetical protein ACKKCO_004110 [Escherichia coli]